MPRARIPSLAATLLLAAVAAGSALGSSAAQAQATTWQYALIADSPLELASFSVPAVNDAGRVTFVATFDDPDEGQALYRSGEPGLLNVVADTSGVIKTFLGNPDINSLGDVSFAATLDDDSVSVFATKGSALVTIANTTAHGLASLDSKPFISDTDGAVVVRGVRSSDGARVILKGTGAGAPAVLLDSTGDYDPQDVAGINADGVVAFEALTAGGTIRGVYRTIDGVAVTPVDFITAGGPADLQALDITNDGTVVFFSRDGVGTDSLRLENDGTALAFADTTGPFSTFGPAAVGESGFTAFRGTFDLGLDAIFAGGTLVYERATAVGDILLGSAITVLDTGPQAVTNSGNFVFRASRANGTSGIYLARRVPRGSSGGGSSAVDVVSIGLLLVASALGVGRRRRAAAMGGAA